ncbi:unnamed protein product [Meganyctiphanes norvegica]|uniref:BTB domain-containing protein n=1 Tax=Meganyctiphanes norvegica TaxID=48144 RepID=A0AAV2RDZ9_MEGNR
MEPGQQFCLRWNNYQSTLQHVFHKQWVAGNFVDVSLIVEGRRLDCHKMVLSACSSYFETLLQEHSSHNHPFIILHDLSYHAVESIINFMYQGQVNVSQEQLADLLKVAEALKVKGLADSNAINSFSKSRLLQNLPLLERTAPFPNVNVNYPNTTAGYQQRVPSAKPAVNKFSPKPSVGRQPFKNLIEVAGGSSVAKVPQKKRPRQDDPNDKSLPTTLPNSLPPTPPSSHNDTSLNESQPSPMTQSIPEVFTPKQEADEETDGELQIDESAAPSPAEPDSRPGSRGPENDMRDQDEENNPHPRVLGPTSESNLLNPLHTYTVSPFASQEQGLLGDMKNIFGDMKNIKIEKPNYTIAAAKNPNMISMPKNMVKTYTNKDLEDGIESVLSGKLTPAKAISKFRIPRRTFFRRLSAVRKERGIPSAKENTADYYLSSDASANVNLGALADAQNRLALPTPNAGQEKFQALKIKSDKQLLVEPKKKKAKKSDEVMTPNDSYFSLLNFATSNNYDTYLNYLKFVAQQPDARSAAEGAIDALKKAQGKDSSAVLDSNRNGIMVDGNSNLASVDNAMKNGTSDSRSASPSSDRSMSPVDNGKELHAENSSESDTQEDDESRIITPEVTEAALALLSQKRDATLALVTQNGGSKSPLLKDRGRSADSSVSVS